MSAPLPSSHGDFVNRVVGAVEASFKEGNRGREIKLNDRKNAQKARFALAANSSVYVQSAISMLHVSDENLQLAPASIYSTDAMNSLRESMKTALKRERERRSSQKGQNRSTVAKFVASGFGELDGIFDYLQALAAAVGQTAVLRRLDTVKNIQSFETTLSTGSDETLIFVLRALDWMLDEKSDGSLPSSLSKYILSAIEGIDPENSTNLKRQQLAKQAGIKQPKPVQDSSGEEEEPVHTSTSTPLATPQSTPQSSEATPQSSEATPSSSTRTAITPQFGASVTYALQRGLCGHRGPHQVHYGQTDGLHVDDELAYSTPSNIAYTLRMSSTLDRQPDDVNEACSAPFARRDLEASIQHFGGNFAIDDAGDHHDRAPLTAARQVRWQPIGEHANAFASAAAIEHAVARCKRLARQAHVGPMEKAMILGALVGLKARQLHLMHTVSVAIEDGEEPVGEHGLVTRPMGRFRGKLVFAQDAGHHTLPTQVDESGRGGWDQAMVEANRSFKRKRCETVGSTTSSAPTTLTFLAPKAEHTGFIPAPQTATGAPPMNTFEEAMDDETYFLERLRKIVDYGLYFFDIPTDTPDVGGGGAPSSSSSSSTFSTSSTSSPPSTARRTRDNLPPNTPEEKRKVLWNDFLRYIAVANDKVIVFIRTLSGLIGEDADSLLVSADAATAEASKELAAQKRQIAGKVADFQTKVVEVMISGAVKESGLKLKLGSNQDEQLLVIDGKTEKELADLASGQSGRPFFEANVALRSLCEESKSSKKSLPDLMGEVAKITAHLSDSLMASVVQPETGGVSIAELATPRNSYFVRLRDDTTASIRTAYDRMCSEMRIDFSYARMPSMWELIEGADPTLTLRFSEFVGHMLVSARTSTGVSALYASSSQIGVNAMQSQMSIRRLCVYAASYTGRTPAPNFGDEKGRENYFDTAPGDGCGLHIVSRSATKRTHPVNYGQWVGGIAY